MLFYNNQEHQRRKRFAVLAIMTLAAIALLGVAGSFDNENEKIELEIYCANVRDHTWPDYEGKFKSDCKKVKQHSSSKP